MYKPCNILVTGGCGFIGTNFLRFFKKHAVFSNLINLDNLTYAANTLNDDTIFMKGDISDSSLVGDLLREYQIDTIINFAAESHVDRSIEDPLLFTKTNTLGVVNLLDVAKNYWLEEKKFNTNQCRFYQISTDEVFGSLSLNDRPSRETDPYAPRSPYSASKAGADHFVRAYHSTFNLPVVMSHSSNNYGPYQHAEKFIPTVIRACLSKKAIPIYGNGNNIRDWLFVEDHCRAICLVLEKGVVGESYNIGANMLMNNNDLVTLIGELMNTKPIVHYVEDRKGHDFRYDLDISKISKTLNWKPTVALRDGLLKTIQSIEQHVVCCGNEVEMPV